MPADLEALVAARDHRGVAALLTGLSGLGGPVDADPVAVRRWYRATGRRQAREAAAVRNRDAGTVAVLLAVGLAGPRDAARDCDFAHLTGFGRVGGQRLLPVLEIAARRGRDWCRDYVEAVSQRPVLASWASPEEVAAVCLPLVAHHGLDVPPGPAYAHGWASLAVASQRSQDAGELETHLARLDESGRASYVPGIVPSSGFRTLLAATPQRQQTLERVLETPRALSVLTYLDQPGWLLGPAVQELVAEGLVARTVLIDAALRALTAGHRPSEQRVAATFLEAAGFGPADAAERVPLMLQVLATVHGSVTAVVLPVLLATPLDPDDLHELGSVVLVRREKAQKLLLLDRLEQVPRDDPRDATVAELLREAARLDDRALAERAEDLLRSRGAGTDERDPGTPLLDIAWDDLPPAPDVEDFRSAPATPAGLAQLRAEQRTDLLKEARWLDLVVRRGAVDAAALRSEVTAWPPQSWVDTAAERFLVGWATGRAPASPASWLPARGHRLLATALANETMARLGTVPELLSTPSREDGTIAWPDLVARLHRAGTTAYAPADLLQALLRLDPVSPDQLDLLDAVSAVPRRPRTGLARWWSGRAADAGDAASVVRSWVEGGGLPARRATVIEGYANLPPVRLPAVPPRLQGDPLTEDLVAGLRSSEAEPPPDPVHHRLQGDRYLAVVPWWAEVLAADEEAGRLEHRGVEPSSLAAALQSPGPLGPAVHLHAARLLAGDDPVARSRTVELVLAAASRRRLDPGLLAEECTVLLDAGVLSLSRVSDAWEQAVLGGGLAFVWPSIRAVLERATATRPLPTGLAELLRMVRPYVATVAAHVAGDVLPPGVAALAGTRSATKARAEARALLGALAATREAA